MFRLICLLIGYIFGCFQTAVIVSKVFYKKDIREHGSKSAGMTNTMRVLGAQPGLAVFVIDVLKAVMGYCLCSALFHGSGTFFADGISYLPGLYGGIGVILGHNFPVFLKFKGGKGVASTLGVILCINIWLALIIYVVGIVVLAVWKYVSLASLSMTALLPVLLIIFQFSYEEIGLGLFIGVLAYYQHRGNIERLIKGKENKFSVKPKQKIG